MEIEITKVSSKGQIVIPKKIREKLSLTEGETVYVIGKEDSVILKKIEIPEIKSWKEVSKPFEKAVKSSGFEKKDLMKIIEESRLRNR